MRIFREMKVVLYQELLSNILVSRKKCRMLKLKRNSDCFATLQLCTTRKVIYACQKRPKIRPKGTLHMDPLEKIQGNPKDRHRSIARCKNALLKLQCSGG